MFIKDDRVIYKKTIRICLVYVSVLAISGCSSGLKGNWNQQNNKQEILKVSKILIDIVKKNG